VTSFSPGDEVFGFGTGTFAEFACARESALAHKPSALSFQSAAVLPTSGLTAYEALVDHGRVAAGRRVLVLGASGGVGSFAVQLAKLRGAHVTGVCSGPKADFVRGLGADQVVDHGTEDITGSSERFDLIVDLGGRLPVSALRRLLTHRGTLVIVGGEGGGAWTGGLGRQLRAVVLSPFVSQRLTTFIASERGEQLEALADLAARGDLNPALGGVAPLGGVSNSLRMLEDGGVRGKLAIAVGTAADERSRERC
jgi:NADPH:quinone reductase-like Zn-dependent oxidoreductase